MQLAPIAPHASPLFNLHVLSTSQPTASGRTDIVTDTVTFGTLRAGMHGGSRITTQYTNGAAQGSHIRAYYADVSERQAAAALADAITGSGLLQQAVPADRIGPPTAGLTRIYLDRRSRMLEFDTQNPPAVAQAVLDALEAYRAIALR